MHIVSWNVNGLRAVLNKGLIDWLAQTRPDVVGLQETKLQAGQIPPQMQRPLNYHAYWSHAERKGYSGVALLCKQAPREVREGFGVPRFDCEGRTLVAEFDTFTLINCYFPNGGQGPERLQYKLEFYAAMLDYINVRRAQGRPVMICGDFNTAHQERDLARPNDNRENSGFMDIERAWVDRYLETGLIDAFRQKTAEGGHYTWWTYRFQARKRNVGWRIDYFLITPDLLGRMQDASIWPDVEGSDHCPISLDLDG